MDKTTLGGFAGGWGLVALAIILGGVGLGVFLGKFDGYVMWNIKKKIKLKGK